MFRAEDEIKQEMLDNIKNTVDKSQNSLVHDSISPAALEFANFYMYLESIENKFDVEKLDGSELERFIKQRTGITRKPALKATTIVTIRGQQGGKISKGDLVSTEEINFVSLENKAIGETGQMNVEVECTQYGIAGNVPAGTIKYFPTAINGLVSVINPDAVANGYDAESDSELRQRYYERVRTPATSGNKYHYLAWAKEVLGVGDAKVIPLWNGAGTVKVIIVDSNRHPAIEELRQEVFEHIEEERPIGASVTVVSATAKNITIAASVNLADGYKIQEVQEDFNYRIEEYRQDIAFKDSYISYAAVGNVLFSTNGVLDYGNLKLNGDTKNIALQNEEIPVFDINLGVM